MTASIPTTSWDVPRNRDGRGERWVERTTPKRFRMGTPGAHRKIVGRKFEKLHKFTDIKES